MQMHNSLKNRELTPLKGGRGANLKEDKWENQVFCQVVNNM
jgi:hypothetical protein